MAITACHQAHTDDGSCCRFFYPSEWKREREEREEDVFICAAGALIKFDSI